MGVPCCEGFLPENALESEKTKNQPTGEIPYET